MNSRQHSLNDALNLHTPSIEVLIRCKLRVSGLVTHVRVICGDMEQLDVIRRLELIEAMWVPMIHPVR